MFRPIENYDQFWNWSVGPFVNWLASSGTSKFDTIQCKKREKSEVEEYYSTHWMDSNKQNKAL